MRSTGRAPSTQRPSGKSPRGPSSTGRCGRPASTACRTTSRSLEGQDMDEQSFTEDAVVIERAVDAPVSLVWRMWTDPELFRTWYGPSGATIPVATMDVRIGGARHLCME